MRHGAEELVEHRRLRRHEQDGDIALQREGTHPVERLRGAEDGDGRPAHHGAADDLVGARDVVLAIDQRDARSHAAHSLVGSLGRAPEAHRIAKDLDERPEQRRGDGVVREHEDRGGGAGREFGGICGRHIRGHCRKWCTGRLRRARKLVVFTRVSTFPPLPIDAALPALRQALRATTSAVLQAPPGAGKTTRVPLALLHEPWLAGRGIVMLEPRRLAARAAARYMAALLGERVGSTVGYRVRLDTQVSPATRIEVVTEGILARRLQDDPALEGVGLVIFDEFHERSLAADLGLALTLQSRAVLRDDLRILVMSATLHGAPVAALLGDAPVITSEGRAFPVETRYAPPRAGMRLEAAVAAAVNAALARDDGDVLVFLPGAGEIHRVAALLADIERDPAITIAPLFGNLAADAQDRAILPSPPGRRKVVLATPIAETSLTIEGVRVVIDAGLVRVPRFSPRTGMARLETVRVSRASADQRRGRAGRVAPGVCYRLWAEAEQQHLLPFALPEIAEADLAPLALDLAAAGVRDPAELRWLDAPPDAAHAQARELLGELGALDDAGRITPHGRRMASLGIHPRLAHMVVRGTALGHGWLACRLAALLGERDVLRGESGGGAPAGPPDADVRLRLDVMGGGSAPPYVHGWKVDRETARRARLEAEHLARQLHIARDRGDDAAAGVLLALAYPDRIAQRRAGSAGTGRFLLRNGRGATFAFPQALSDEPYVVAAELDDQRPESRIFLAAPVALEDVLTELGTQVTEERVVEWDEQTQTVVARVRQRLGALVLRDAPLPQPEPEEIAGALLTALARAGIAALPWSDAARRLRERLAFVHALDAAWPDVSDTALAASLAHWLGPHLVGLRRRDEVARLDLGAALLGLLDWEQRRRLDELAPTHVVVPSGSRIPIDYGEPASPVLAVRLQEVFGLTETPRVGGGRVPVTMHLLSPAHRPVQVTRDLAGFWRTSYFDVRKDMKGRYPKHYWPDDPLAAEPTRRAKPRGT